MQHHQSKKKNDSTLRSVSEFYSIPLEDDYTLTQVVLKECIDMKTLKRESWFYPDLKLLSFKDGTAEILNKNGKTSFRLFLKVEKDNLHIACSCAVQVEKLCKHAYVALEWMVMFSEKNYLKKLLPDGIAQTVIANRKYFETKPGLDNIFKPKPMLGSVYAVNEKLESYSIDDVLSLPAVLDTKSENKEFSMCYILMIPRRNDLLPFLLPCMGKLNKAGTNIKSYGNFLSGTQKEYDAMLTEEQKTLNKICYDMWLLVEKLPPKLIHAEMMFDEMDGLSHLFSLWQKAISILQEQHTYKHPYFQKRQLKGKPGKSWIRKIHIRKDVPVIQFLLTQKEAFYQLEIQPIINKKIIAKYKTIDTFFIGNRDDVYMLSSIRDAAIVEWMERSGNRITIFKEHFPAFEKNFLQPLRKYYVVKGNSVLR